MKITDNDKQQIKSLILWYFNTKKYFPFAEQLIEQYKIFFPNDIDSWIKDIINELSNEVIIEYLEDKKTKSSKLMLRILQNNEES